MAARRTLYKVVGRYINVKDKDKPNAKIVAYELVSEDQSKSGKYSIEQLAYLVGRKQVVNVTAQVYKDNVIFRGKDVNLSDLPAKFVTEE